MKSTVAMDRHGNGSNSRAAFQNVRFADKDLASLPLDRSAIFEVAEDLVHACACGPDHSCQLLLRELNTNQDSTIRVHPVRLGEFEKLPRKSTMEVKEHQTPNIIVCLSYGSC